MVTSNIRNFAVGAFAVGLMVGNASPTKAAINLVQDPSFEEGSAAWQEPGPSVSSHYNSSEASHTGSYGADFSNTGSLGYIYQTLATAPGAYLISFWLTNPHAVNYPSEFQVSFDGTVVFDLNPVPDEGWTQYSLIADTIDTSTVLLFGGRQDPSDLFLDDVSVTAVGSVPEPASLAVAFIGFGLVGWRVRGCKA